MKLLIAIGIILAVALVAFLLVAIVSYFAKRSAERTANYPGFSIKPLDPIPEGYMIMGCDVAKGCDTEVRSLWVYENGKWVMVERAKEVETEK